MNTVFVVECQPLQKVEDIQGEWLDLESKTNHSFFLSWAWIYSWLQSCEPSCSIIRVSKDSELVALGILSQYEYKGGYRASSQRLLLNQTGDWLKDQMWIEYNGLLCLSEYEDEIIHSVLNHFRDSLSGWDELVLGGVTKKKAKLFENASELQRLDLWHSPTYGVDLHRLRESGCEYLDSLSKNTRYQIRRSLRRYAELEPLRLEKAKTQSQALEYFDQIEPLHRARWGDELGQSGFANEHFITFHKTLIKYAFPEQQIEIIRIMHGEKPVGYLYNFTYRDTVYFYLGGFVSEADSRLKPGLCGHALAIDHYIKQDYKYYDFMGGNDRYKASLGELRDELFQIALRKDKFKFKFESVLRRIKHVFLD